MIYGPSNADAITVDTITEMMRKAAAMPKPTFDAIVCLPLAYDAIRAQTVEKLPLPFYGVPLWPDRLYGVPIYLALTEVEASRLCFDLRREGKRPLLVRAPGDPECADVKRTPDVPHEDKPA